MDYKELNESEEISLPFQKGNGGKDNPVLSVMPQRECFTAHSISSLILKQNTVMKLERGEFLLLTLSTCGKIAMLHHHKWHTISNTILEVSSSKS